MQLLLVLMIDKDNKKNTIILCIDYFHSTFCLTVFRWVKAMCLRNKSKSEARFKGCGGLL